MIKHPTQSKWRKKRFIWVHSSRVQVIMVGMSWNHDLEVAAHITAILRKQSDECCCSPSSLSNFCRFCRVPWVLWGSVFSWIPLNCQKPGRKHPKWASNYYCHLQPFCFLQSPIRSDALGLSAPMDLPTSYQHLLWECTWVGTDLNASFLRTRF